MRGGPCVHATFPSNVDPSSRGNQHPSAGTHGDFDYSGAVNWSDFKILGARFGQVLAPHSPFRDTALAWHVSGVAENLDDGLA